MKRCFSILLFLFTILSLESIDAQTGGLPVDIFTIKDGLSQTRVNTVYIDSKGFLWIGTHNGLNKYNGYEFQIFQYQSVDSNSLSNNFIYSICEDQNHDLWIGTRNGLSKFNRKTEKFQNYYQNIDNPNSLIDNEIFYVYMDKEGVLWIKTLEHLSRYNPEKDEFIHFEHYNDYFNFVEGTNYFSIFEDNEGKLWIGTKDGLNYFNKDLGLFERFEYNENDPNSISNNRIKTIFEDSKSNLWIGTENGLNKYNRETRSFIKYFEKPFQQETGPVNNNINDIYEDKDGILWIGTANGISKFHPKTGKFSNAKTFYVGYNVLGTSVNHIVEDNSQIMWMATTQGLVKYDKKRKKFNTYSKSINSLPELSSNSVNSVLIDHQKHLWIGTSFGLNLVYRNSGKVKQYSSNNRNPKYRISNDNVFAIHQDKRNYIWLGTGNGIDIYNPFLEKFSPACELEDSIPCEYFKNNKINTIYEDKKNNIWIGSNRGLFQFNYKQKKFSRYIVLENDSARVDLVKVFCINEDENGIIWVGTDNGFVKFNPKTTEFYHFTRDANNGGKNLLSSNLVYEIEFDDHGNTWIGTISGLNKFNPQLLTFQVFTEKEGLANNMIHSIEKDENGNLWISTNKGISKIDPTENEFINFDISDGLQGYEFNFNSSYKSENGEIFFGGISGLNYFHPDSIDFNKNIPGVVINSITLYTTAGKKYIPLSGKDEIIIPPGHSMFNIDFASLDFTWPEKNRYAYKIIQNGNEREWLHIGNQHYTTFSNVAPGEYILKVKASNNDNTWNDEGASIKLIIETPFWKSNLAAVCYILTVLLILYGIYLYRTKSLRESNKILKEKELAAIKIREQKEALTLQNKAITDSINYARRIQQALMPSLRTFDRLLPNSFVFHKPKDIVSGDFYWINESKNKIFVASVDCTGHGVPGAFMSIIGFELFRNITLFKGIEKPGEILNVLNNDFAEIFKDVDNITLRDGMDVAFCAFDKKKNTVEFAGAYNPLYIIRDNKIIEIKADRFSIGLTEQDGEKKNFTNHEIEIQKNDVFYMFSDGYVDQFGGPEGKKFKFRRFRHLLLSNHKLALADQREQLEKSIDAWKGTNEQVDDILIIGIKPNIT